MTSNEAEQEAIEVVYSEATIKQQIGLLEQRRADLQVGLQQQLLARIAETGVEFGAPIVRTEIPREPTLWERSEMREANIQRAFASEQDPSERLSLNDWLDAQ